MILNLPQREENLRKRRRAKYAKFWIAFLILALFLAVVSYISHIPKFRISEVVLSGGVLVTEKEISEKSKSFMKGSLFLLFPKNNIFLYQKSKLKNHLADSFKRIETIEINKDGFNKIVVDITERKPVAVWCRESVAYVSTSTSEVTPNSEECYFMDLNSVIFDEAPNFSGDAYFKYYGLLLKERPIGERYIASSTQFTDINNFIELVKNLNIKPLQLVAKGDNEFSIILYGGGEIYFDVTKSIINAYKNLETLLQSSEFTSVRSGILPVEYIDLRYGNKLFYKLK